MPVFDRLVAHLLADETSYVRKGIFCDECLPAKPCLGHWTLDGEYITQAEFAKRAEAVGDRLTKGLATLDWERVIDAAHIYAHIRGGWREEINGGDLFLAMTEPTTMTDGQTHVESMTKRWPRLLADKETPDG